MIILVCVSKCQPFWRAWVLLFKKADFFKSKMKFIGYKNISNYLAWKNLIRVKKIRDKDIAFQSSFSKETLSRKRPFVPLKAEDIRSGDIIKFSRPGGKISKG